MLDNLEGHKQINRLRRAGCSIKVDAQPAKLVRLDWATRFLFDVIKSKFSTSLYVYVYCTVTFLLISTKISAQSYGLRFAGHEEILEKRTVLNLTPERPLCFNGNVELSFDLMLAPNYSIYFGYIFRLIQNEKQNLDLLYDQKSKSFKVIINGRFSRSTIQLDSAQLVNQWNQFAIKLDLNQHKLLVYANKKLVISDTIPFDESGCFRLFFGGNEFKGFRSKDLPPMSIRDIAITEDGKRSYHWPLNEIKGNTTKDEIAGQMASVKNPVWIKSLHNEWQLAGQFTVKGGASVAFNPASETVYVIGSDALCSYSVRNRQTDVSVYKNPPPSFLLGNQAIYNPLSNKLYTFYVDQKAVSDYNPLSRSWKSEAITPKSTIATEYWHANKFIAGIDSSLYVLGGYGQLTYKNSVQRYHFDTRKWETIPTKGNVYTPRYLAALGTTSSADTAYLIGGYGSLTGEQMLNPKSTYDLLQYVVKENTFKKLYELPGPDTDFAFANSLVIDSKTKSYYGLIFPNQQFKSHLQLIRGSLSEPTYQSLGRSIPYQFHDTHSFADLYYCQSSQKLLTATTYRNETNGTTDVRLYTISFPPNVVDVQVADKKPSVPWYWLLILAGAGLAGALLFLYFRSGRNANARTVVPLPSREPVYGEKEAVNEVKPTANDSLIAEPLPKASFFFFGNFQVIDHRGNDLTKSFTPLIKELFLLLALNSIGKQRGVPSEKLNELLWPDKSDRDAGNNRSVNLTKLRNILEKVGGCTLSKESGYWNVTFEFNQIYVDYERYIGIINGKSRLTKQTIVELEEITKRGPFLLNTEYQWLDDFKADISSEIVTTFQHYSNSVSISDDPEFIIQLTNFIFYYDPVNEDAIALKCKALALLGQHTLAKNTFEKFVRDYKDIYGEAYNQTFSAIID